MVTAISAAGPGPPLGFSRGLIEHAHEQQRLFRALVGKRSGQLVQKKFRELVLDLVREDLSLPCSPPGHGETRRSRS